MFILKKTVKEYFKLSDQQIESLFSKYPEQKIFMAYGGTYNHYQDLPDRLEERRKMFGRKLKS